MTLTLQRDRYGDFGIFGQLLTPEGTFIAYTLEHSYSGVPKIAPGTYTCVRGEHILAHMTEDFATFEITQVPDFQGKAVSGILFHWGNYNDDSEGCILLGLGIETEMITNSREAFRQFMSQIIPLNCDTFTLTIKA